MDLLDRRPEDCPYRRGSACGTAGLYTCELAARLAATATCFVDRPTCEACCRDPLPGAARVTPVVASLALAALDSKPTSPLDVHGRFDEHHARQFAIRHLAQWRASEAIVTCPEAEEPAQAVHHLTSPKLARRTTSATNGSADHRLKLGLLGRNSRYGLGHVNREIVKHLQVDRWLVPLLGNEECPAETDCRVDALTSRPRTSELRTWVRGLDALIFVEEPVFWAVTAIAREHGVRVICVPNWEWLQPAQAWLENVDLMLAPTQFTATHLGDWKLRYGFDWRVECVPWPIDVDHFQFRRRYLCRKFVYIHGSGGATCHAVDDPTVAIRRKGLDVVLGAARLTPHIPIIIYADPQKLPEVPANVEVRMPPLNNSHLYGEGDVCIQPSRWEGLGLPLLECQAAGMPLITTDAPPMNEHSPFAVIPSREVFAKLTSDLLIPAACPEPDELAAVMQKAHHRWIFQASGRARRFVEQQHNWARSLPRIQQAISSAIFAAH